MKTFKGTVLPLGILVILVFYCLPVTLQGFVDLIKAEEPVPVVEEFRIEDATNTELVFITDPQDILIISAPENEHIIRIEEDGMVFANKKFAANEAAVKFMDALPWIVGNIRREAIKSNCPSLFED